MSTEKRLAGMANANNSKYNYMLEQNKNYMDYPALSFDSKKVTYGELHENIQKYAIVLSKKGVKAGDVVGACVLNTPESVYILYALDVLGANVVGLNPFANEKTIRDDLLLTKPSMVISVDLAGKTFENLGDELGYRTLVYPLMESTSDALKKLGYNLMKLKSGNHSLSKSNNLVRSVKGVGFSEIRNGIYIPNAATDIMFTGGSTGIHKGVDLNGAGLNFVVEGANHSYDFKPGMVYLGNIPIGHMCFGKALLHMSLCNNLEFALTLKAMPDDFYNEIVRTRSNLAAGGPPHWMSLISKDENGFIVHPKVKKDSLNFLQYAGSGGEALKEDANTAINNALVYAGSKTRVGNGYGATEAWSCMILNSGPNNTPGTLGNKIECLKFRIVDPVSFEEVQKGESGLLLVSGKPIMLGYHNNPEETAKVMIKDEDGTRWFNTGDIICELPSGEYKYTGRIKRNFVSGVENIYPEVLEALLIQIPEIREVVVTKVPDFEKQNIPRLTVSVFNDNFDTVDLEKRIRTLIVSNLSESWLPGNGANFIEYTDEPLKRMSNSKVDIGFYQARTDEQFRNAKNI